ncbi:protein MODIFIER OF SNC1 1 isoform X1 [Dendrobium catenatum]|uniref:protein MODIFIER OF SNC1 1 isoform X1 n=1 Tax=Dendrobium catenatum TaxID=906689 RepID=UPI0009F66CB7|nr:protein MODIFIER OF SNC1 1 isoform X1 [Dendrobium catenatum]
MASSMLPAERRWTSTRKSGMTVLGKVPKPINLPSQKLENHGLDPNVEIVPKGTLTWGTRPLLAASSAWGSSNLSSPRADGNMGSPIHANGRPSSGGSGTRPSTGSSERSSEPVSSSWGSSSRPSSASGILPSSHMSVAANRPRSAETRPNSSHLSRFAESSTDGIAWGAAGTSEKFQSAEVSKRSDFTLSSGDFPSLGSEKSDEPKSQQGQTPKAPTPALGASSSSKGTTESLLTSGNGNPGLALHGNFNSWNADTHPHAGEGSSSRTENWHRENHSPQHLLDASMPARQYGPWHGPPAHHSNVVWYGGHEAGGFYRPPFAPPGSYHADPYYPYVPAGALPNTQAFPRAEAIPDGIHLKKGEAYRHRPPESYIAHGQSGNPIRPGVYPGPVLYEGCYGPTQSSFDNSSEQDGSTLGMPGQYGVHNQHLSENLRYQPWRFHAQPDGSGPVMTKQQMISSQANGTQGQYKVLLKHHGSPEEKDIFGKEHTVTVWSAAQRGKQPGFSTTEPGLLDNGYKQEQTTEEWHDEVSHSQHPNDLVDQNNKNSSGTSKYAGQNVKKKLDNAAVHSSDQQNAIVKKNASLMEKVEGLNSKTRVVDVHLEGENFPTKEMRSNQNSSSDEGHFEEVGPANSSSADNSRNVGASKLNTPTKVIIHESVLELKPTHQWDELVIEPGKSNYSEDCGQSQSHNQKRVRNTKGRVDQHGKLKFGSYGANDTNNTLERDSFEKTRVATGKSGYLLSIPHSHASQVVPEDQGSHLSFNSVSDPSSLKSVDLDVQQHSKLKEPAMQRAIELQKEEEERTAEQKAKALVKLSELNKRVSANSKHNSRHDQPLCNDNPIKPDTTSGKDVKSNAVSQTLHGGSLCDSQVKKHPNDGNIIKLRDPAYLSFTQPTGTSDSVKAHVSIGEQSRQLCQEGTPEIITARSASDLQDSIVSKRKQAWNRRRRNFTDERNQSEKFTNSESSGNTKCASMVIEEASDGLEIQSSDPPVQVSKNNRGPKYKNKLSDTQLNSTHLEGYSGKFDVDSDEIKHSPKLLEPLSVAENNSNEIMRGQDSIDLMVEPNQAGPEPTKITTERASNWKHQPHRNSARNLQSDKANAKYQGSETVVWAPVKMVSKDGSSEVHKSSANEVTNLPDGKNAQDMHNGAKARRAEIERYVPKPIAKDSQQSSPSIAPSSSADKMGKRELASASAVTGRDVSSTVAKPALNSMNTEDTKQSRHGKTQPSWRQRNSGESPSLEQCVLEGSLSSGSSKFLEKTSELHHSRPGDDVHVEGGNNLQGESIGIVEDHGMTRQRRQQFKEVRVDGSSCTPHSKVLQGEVPNKKEMQSAAPADSGERNHSRNESQNASSGHVKSHWQPKSQVHSQQYVHGYKGSGGQKAAEKMMPSRTIEKNLDDSGSVVQRNMIEVDDMKHHEAYREIKAIPNELKNQEGAKERKVMYQPSKDQNQFIDSDLTAPTESASANANIHQDYLGVPRRGQNRGHFPRGGDAMYGGSKKAHLTRNAEQHFEYQTGYNKDGDIFHENFSPSEEPSEAHRVSSGSRYGMQGRNHSRRAGHFYRPQRGASVRVNGAYDIGG